MVVPILALLFVLTISPQSDGCRLGYTVSKLTVKRVGEYKITCSSRPYPICPEFCYWTNQTCEEYSRRNRWTQENHILTNITYAFIIRDRAKRGDKKKVISQQELPRKSKTLVSLSSAAKNVQRKCCISRWINSKKCRTVDWQPTGANGYTFNVSAYGKNVMKCNRNDSVIRDIKVKNFKTNQFSIEVCCLNYTGAASVVACALHGGGGEAAAASAAAAAAAIALPLALGLGLGLGIGVPLSKRTTTTSSTSSTSSATTTTTTTGSTTSPPLPCTESLFRPHTDLDNYVLTCSSGQTTQSIDQNGCCTICSNQPGSTCLFATGATAILLFPASAGQPTCSVCPMATGPTQSVQGTIVWYPANAPFPLPTA